MEAKSRTTAAALLLTSPWFGMALLMLGGCTTNMSGIGGEATFQCKAPDGVQCQSVSGTYANARAGTLPSQSQHAAQFAAVPTVVAQANGALNPPSPPNSSLAARPGSAAQFGAIRSEATLIRIWVAPWEDADGDLMDQTYVYLTVDAGRWLIEHNRQSIKRDFAPVRAPSTAGTAAPTARSAAARQQRDEEESPPDGAAAVAAGIARMRSGKADGRADGTAPGATP